MFERVCLNAIVIMMAVVFIIIIFAIWLIQNGLSRRYQFAKLKVQQVTN